MKRVPSNATRLPWKKIPGGAEQGIKYEWVDSATGDKWRVRAHEMDPSPKLSANSNAGSGWVYRVETRYGNKGKWYTMDSSGKFHPENVFNESSPLYNEAIANDAHIPFLDSRYTSRR